MIRTRLIAPFLTIALLAGCAMPTVGSNATFGDTTLANPSPVTLHIQDQDKEGTASGPGPASYDRVRDDGVQSFSSGLNRTGAIVRRAADGSLTTSFMTGKDSTIKNTSFNPKTGEIKIGEIVTSASEPIRAHNEAYPPLAEYWAARDEKSKQIILKVIDAVDAGLGAIFRTAVGIP